MSFDPNGPDYGETSEHQHRRYNPLKDDWILVSPHRALRPWQGQVETPTNESVPTHDPKNPLCPGVVRPSGALTPNYESTYVFDNDFPALLDDVPAPPPNDDPLFQAAEARGTCKVICFHPRLDVHLATMSTQEVLNIIEEWIKQMKILGAKYDWVQIFENRGIIMGCSNPHPHCQIWASNFIPNEPRIKDRTQLAYYQKHGRQLLMDYVDKELTKRERIVCENDEWVALVPYWAAWPFETMVLPKRQVLRFTDTDAHQREKLAFLMQILVAKYDNLFKCSFPYSMGWHGAPTGSLMDNDQNHWTFHGVYLPPLLRSATIRKFMVGYELLAQSQRDLSPEKAAKMIREQPEKHYSLL